MSVIYFGRFLSIVTSNISSALFFPSASGFEIIPQKNFQCLDVLFFKLFLSSNFISDLFSSLLSLSSVVLSLLMSSSKGFFTCIVLFLLLRVVFFLMLFSQNVQSHQQTHHFSMLTLSIWLSTFPFFIILNIVILNSSSGNSNICVLSGSSSDDYFISSDCSLFPMPFSLT